MRKQIKKGKSVITSCVDNSLSCVDNSLFHPFFLSEFLWEIVSGTKTEATNPK